MNRRRFDTTTDGGAACSDCYRGTRRIQPCGGAICCVCASLDRRHGQGRLGRGLAGRHGGSVESGAHREDALGRFQRRWPILDSRPEAGHLYRHVHAAGIQHGQARRHRAGRRVHRDRERGSESGRRRRDDYGQRRSAGRGRHERAHRADASAVRRLPRFPRRASIPRSRSSCPRSTCRATTSAGRRETSSACSRFTADAATKGRSSLTA